MHGKHVCRTHAGFVELLTFCRRKGSLIFDLLPIKPEEKCTLWRCFHMTDDSRVYVELTRNLHHCRRRGLIGKEFQTMAHIEDLVHLPVIGAGCFLYQP